MGNEDHLVTLTGTGNQPYSGLTRMPVKIEFLHSQEGSGADAVVRYGSGVYDPNTGVERADATFSDGVYRTEKDTTKSVIVLDKSGVNVVRKVEANVVSLDNNGGGDYGFTLNQTINTIAVQQRVRVWY